MRKLSNRASLALKLSVLAVASCYAGSALALPTAPVVAAGQASFATSGKQLTVTNTPGAIINWGGFSIRADEIARFQQQSAASSVLNRVTGRDPSQILGQLQSNGRVFLLNPNGVVFGPGSRVDVAGLVVSTLNLSDADFVSGRMRFTDNGSGAGVVNQGEIRTPIGGQVFLVAPRVENQGLITAPGGDVLLAAGRTVEISDLANPSIRVEIVAPAGEALNIGKLVATGGRVNLVGALVRNSGTVSADAVVSENGKIFFRRGTGRQEERAGNVAMKASESLVLEAGSSVTADGPVAGEVRLESGGDLTVQSGALVSARGADGGVVDAAARGALAVNGTIDARGDDGKGGTVRLSGAKVALASLARVDVSGALKREEQDTGRITVQATESLVLESGSALSADGPAAGEVRLESGGDLTMESDARISANGPDGGIVDMRAPLGTLIASGIIEAKGNDGRGGTVRLTGTRVALASRARVDASGTDGGGTVLVGGDYQGGNPEVQNAERTYVGPDAEIHADALEHGDGGKVILWADDTAQFYGSISTRGGANGGNGGFVETSGKNVLQASGLVDAAAPMGAAGQWLLDPNDITINTAGPDTNVTASPNFNTTDDNAIVTTGSIETALNAGTSVTVTTGSAGANTQAGNITVANGIAKTAGGNATLTLTAINDIIFSTNGSDITSTVGALGVTLNAVNITSLRDISLNGGILTLNHSGVGTQAGAPSNVISGTTSVVKQGAGTFTMSRPNTYTGTTTITGGVLQISANNNLGATPGAPALGNLVFDGGTLATTATFTLNANRGIALNAGGGTISPSAGTLTYNGIAAGIGALNKGDVGQLTLGGANTYTGATNINAGTLFLGTANERIPNTSAVTVAGGATFDLGTRTETIGSLAGAGTVSKTAGAAADTLTVGGDNTSTTFSGVIQSPAGPLNLVKQGTGTFTLSGSNTYSGTTTVSAGTLVVAANNALGTTAGGTTVTSGATLGFSGGIAYATAEAVTINGSGDAGNGRAGAIDNVAGANSFAGAITLGSASTIGASAGTLTLSNTIINGGFLATFNTNTGNIASSGVISGAGGLTKQGIDTLTLSGANTYTGTTTVSAGTLQLGAANVIPDGAGTGNVSVTGTLDLNGFNETINGLSGAGTVDNTAAATTPTLTVGNNDATSTFSGVIQNTAGTLAITKTGAGTLTLSGANTYDGATQVAAGTLIASNASALGSTVGDTSVTAGATLNVNSVPIGAEAVTLNGTGVGGNGALTATGTASLTGVVTLNTDSTIGVATGGDALTLSGAIEGAGALDLAGAGNVTFGSTVGAATALASLTQSASTTLNIGGGLVRTVGNQTYNGTLTTGGVTTLRTISSGDVSVTGEINATAGALTLDIGTGNAALTTNTNDFSTISITSAGAVSLVDANALSIGGITATGLVDVRTQTGDLTLNGAIATTSTNANAVTLVAAVTSAPDATGTGGNFKNPGSSTIATGAGGAWRIYTGNPTDTTRGGLVEAGKRYNVDDGSDPIASGDRIYFRIQPTLTVTADAGQNKVYGDADPTLTYVTSGTLIDGDATFSPAGSLTRAVGETVAGGPYAISVGTLSSQLGYALTFVGDNFAITQRAVTVTADAGQNKVYGNADPASYTYGNTSLGTGVALVGSLTRTAGEPVGSYAITQGGLTNAANPNYTITYAGDNFAISAAPLTVTANDASRPVNQPNPPFSATYGGFQYADTPASLTGTLVFSTTATVSSPPAAYAINPSGQSSANYVISYVPGILTVGATPVAIDPLQSVHTLMNAPAVPAGAPETTVATTAAGGYIFAALDEQGSTEEMLAQLPATAAGPDGEPAKPTWFAGSCVVRTPFSVLRCTPRFY